VKAVVSGGAGFIGSHLVDALVRRGDEVTVLDNLLTGSLNNLLAVQGDIHFVQIDLSTGSKGLPELLAGSDCVFHLAALPSVVASVDDPLTSHAHTGTSTLALLQAMKDARVGRIVFSSSCAIYGDQTKLPWRTDMTPRPLSPYAADKLASEHYLRVFHELYGLNAITLRYFNVYGPRQPAHSEYAAVIPKFLDAARARRSPTIYGNGRQTRDFVHVRDVVRANLLSAETILPHAVLNVASGRQTSLLDLLDVIRRICPSLSEPEFAPARAGEVQNSVGEWRQTDAALGFRARVGLEEGVAEVFEATHN